ncbi:MAG: hypothetical protein ACI9GW_003019 [Halieaceae bacterium]|jgi:hypothetical protein
MKRRAFLKSLALGAGASGMTVPLSQLYAAPAEYSGRLLVVWQMDGGWDVTQFCDPKTNTGGEPDINNWANNADVRTAGNIHYAPVASNTSLFNKHYQNMLVINGVDAQTNAHTTGVLHNWSGRNASGFPTMTALFAAENAADIPLSYINFGGFAETARLIRYSRLDDTDALLDLLQPNTQPWARETRSYRFGVDLKRVQEAQQARLQRMLNRDSITPRQRFNMDSYLAARGSADALERMVDVLPSDGVFQGDVSLGSSQLGSSNLLRQIQLMMLAFDSGVACAGDLFLGGFDTHATHDADHESLYEHVAEALDYFWDFAEERGIADRITLVMGSDFGRTPFYNAEGGKDHWPIGSYVLMEKDAPWGNRVVGLTDGVHNAYSINPATLQRDDAGGTIIYPKHVHQALRTYLGLDSSPLTANFPFSNAEVFDFFNPNLSTGYET